MIEYTLSIIKPDAVKAGHAKAIQQLLIDGGLEIVAQQAMHLTAEQAGNFYDVHRERGFFQELVDFMSSGEVVVQVLKGENAVARNRELMGATNPAEAAEGTIRKLYAASIGENAVHGSDSAENAAIEIKFFFPDLAIAA
jgi:nucleoside-diphosphate kinase